MLIRLLGALLVCGLLVGCGNSPQTPPDDPESLRQAEEEAKKQAKREEEAKKTKGKPRKDRVDRGED